ncbi:MAG: TIGR03960 family B12-binding radical SAM protein [Candidatus Eisenbacteria bacterium]|nr:TIGR03960 family B12-binding radical SAM protein [Candidatus Eisenbacteria bacterium]
MTDCSREIEELVLPLVKKPGRYVGDLAVGCSSLPAGGGLRVLLAFPDTCEIGASNLGLRILASVLSKMDGVLVDLCFAPWPDFEDQLRGRAIPLCSACRSIPLNGFDVVGFSLQYELQYANVVNMLELGGIPLASSQRGESHPLVVAGGSCAFNPEPLSDFIDCFAVGDGEETLTAICSEAALWRKKVGSGAAARPQTADAVSRKELLERLSAHRGLYVPSLYPVTELEDGTNVRDVSRNPPVRSAVTRTIGAVEPVLFLPRIEVAHDRLNVEVMRGCTHGCRFCMAGYSYRPVREKRVDSVLSEVTRAFAASGHDELSLVSLSTPDYSGLPALLPVLDRALSSRGVEVTLPSMRPDTFTPDLVRRLDRFKKSGLTLAPEAGTGRLRDVVNKGMEDEEIVQAIVLAARFGWNLIKLYFMVGLPTETEEDVEAIPALVERALRAARSVNPRVSFNVSVAAFTPKPQTPFQWEPQLPMSEMDLRLRLVAKRIRRLGAKARWRDPGVSHLEGILSRADRRAGAAILSAFRNGARLDAWSDFFRLQVWQDAFQAAGLNAEEYTGPRPVGSRLPWDHVWAVDPAFLLQEREKALNGVLTQDCRLGTCCFCGVLDGTGMSPSEVCLTGAVEETEPFRGSGSGNGAGLAPVTSSLEPSGRRPQPVHGGARTTGGKYRLQYEKEGSSRFLSHLDMVRAFTRAMRASGLPVALSEGFTRRPRVSFGPPLPLGFTGRSEYLDVELSSAPQTDLAEALNRLLPSGVRLLEWKRLEPGTPSLSASCTVASYTVVFPGHLVAGTGMSAEEFREKLGSAVRDFDPSARVRVRREGSAREKETALGAVVQGLSVLEGRLTGLDMVLSLGGPGSLRPDDVAAAILGDIRFEKKYLRVERNAVYLRCPDGIKPPM